jgi:hypothetical protein
VLLPHLRTTATWDVISSAVVGLVVVLVVAAVVVVGVVVVAGILRLDATAGHPTTIADPHSSEPLLVA